MNGKVSFFSQVHYLIPNLLIRSRPFVSVKINFENANENYDVQIFSVLGQKVFEKSFREIPSAAINNLQKGIYFVKITNNSQSVTKKLIVN